MNNVIIHDDDRKHIREGKAGLKSRQEATAVRENSGEQFWMCRKRFKKKLQHDLWVSYHTAAARELKPSPDECYSVPAETSVLQSSTLPLIPTEQSHRGYIHLSENEVTKEKRKGSRQEEEKRKTKTISKIQRIPKLLNEKDTPNLKRIKRNYKGKSAYLHKI